MKNDFITCCDNLITSYNYRENTITEKKQYILNNWNYINNLYKNKLKCPMESQISHTLDDLFSSRPKAYSLNTLNHLLNLRLLYKNEYNIKLLFLNNLNKKDILTFNQEHLNFDIFEHHTFSFDSKLIPTNYHPTHYYDSTYNIKNNDYLILN